MSNYFTKNSNDFLKYQELRFSSNNVDSASQHPCQIKILIFVLKFVLWIFKKKSVKFSSIYWHVNKKQNYFWIKDLRHLCYTFVYSSSKKSCKKVDANDVGFLNFFHVGKAQRTLFF